jgi:hypothetical protein
MSTNNFKFENVLAVVPDFKIDNRCLDEECPHFEEEGIHCDHVSDYYDFDTEGFNMFIDEVKADLVKVGFEESSGCDHDRNYNANYIAEKTIYNSKDEAYKKILVLWRAGYYDGANIDYETEDIYDQDQAKETEFLKSKVAINERKAKRIILKHCTELLKVGQFSNGEAVYELKK